MCFSREGSYNFMWVKSMNYGIERLIFYESIQIYHEVMWRKHSGIVCVEIGQPLYRSYLLRKSIFLSGHESRPKA
jgi:hypothetical protein